MELSIVIPDLNNELVVRLPADLEGLVFASSQASCPELPSLLH
jgi:hypothetical protein